MNVPYGQIVSPVFRWNGRDPQTGLDCYGVVLWYFRQLGIALADYREEYAEGWKERGEHPIADRFADPWVQVTPPLRVHDVLLLTDVGDLEPAHLGVVVDYGRRVLHANPRQGVACCPIEGMKGRIWAVARHKDLL